MKYEEINKLEVNKIPFYVSKESALEFRNKINSRNTSIYENWKEKYSSIFYYLSSVKSLKNLSS
jgi:hypothetical protein